MDPQNGTSSYDPMISVKQSGFATSPHAGFGMPAQPALPPMPAALPNTALSPIAGQSAPLAATPLSGSNDLANLPTVGPAISGSSSMAFPIAPAATPIEPEKTSISNRDVATKLAQANNILVTVSNNPSVDQLSAAIGATLILNKLNKHATSVFSGQVPSTLEFLQPEKTIEKNTDSLRDFIIALDKSKADKLRYKVEDQFVKIFITPYHTSISDKDLEFSQGDFNVDVVLGLGVHKREDLDQAITGHGRILHDATVISVSNSAASDIGTMNWLDMNASSLCEMIVTLIEPLQNDKILLDSQIATALLTGIVAETERFSNQKTSPHTMSTSAILMKAGANQQLVASKLQPQPAISSSAGIKVAASAPGQQPQNLPAVAPVKAADGSMAIEHESPATAPASKSLADLEAAVAQDNDNQEDVGDGLDRIHIDDQGTMSRLAEQAQEKAEAAEAAEAASQASANPNPIALPTPVSSTDSAPTVPTTTPTDSGRQKAADGSSQMILEPPTLGGALSANNTAQSSADEASMTPIEPPVSGPTLATKSRVIQPISGASSAGALVAEATSLAQDKTGQTLADLEKSVDSPHLQADNANGSSDFPTPAPIPTPITSGSDQTADRDSLKKAFSSASAASVTEQASTSNINDNTVESVFPPQLVKPSTGLPADPTAGSAVPSAPPLPPPIIPGGQ